MSLDIEILLWLQALRNLLGGSFDEFFNSISKMAVTVLPLLPLVIYWSVDKDWGFRYFFTFWGGEVTNGLIKLTVCAYRPWIRSNLIEPAGDSKVAATGYSFPSGHTMCATAGYGTTAVWQFKKRRWLAILCAVLILLTGFSRNFLGVHTPQDVLVGFIETAILILIVQKSANALKGREQLKDWLTFAGFPVLILAMVYIIKKPYPMDYVDGKLLVDPVVMMRDTFTGCGGFAGLLLGSYLERHYIHYEIPFGSKRLPLLTAIGIAVYYECRTLFGPAIFTPLLGANWAALVTAFLINIIALTVYPKLIRRFAEEEKEEEKQEALQVPLTKKETVPAK